jgi:feruloyl esterase
MLTVALSLAASLASAAPCEHLKVLSLPNTTITGAELVMAGPYVQPGQGQTQGRGRGAAPQPTVPAHCRIAAVLAPSSDSHIEMEVWLPTEDWNGKFQAVGNGGWAGVISYPAMATALREGYATASTDTGHKGGSASFALGHPEQLIDFGYRSMHEMTVTAKLIVAAFYDRAPRLSYYNGCSTGGRQGLMEAQRYPDDFDAIVAGAPVYNQIHLNTSQVSLQIDMLRDPSLILPPAKVRMLAAAVLNTCDAQDGVKDGIVSNPEMCKFDPATLMCKGSGPGNNDAADCLTAKQVDAARKAYAPVKTKAGAVVYPGHSLGFEAGWRIPEPGTALNPLFADMPRYLARQDANWDVMSFDLDADLALAVKHAGYIESSDPHLAKFKARGGKLLLYHGWADPGPAPANTIHYVNEVIRTLGPKQDDWMRLFLLPGVGHCGGGPGPDQADFVGAIERWRESGTAPDQIPAAHVAGNRVDMTRPLCPYPSVAQYKGIGSTNDAANFVCKLP